MGVSFMLLVPFYFILLVWANIIYYVSRKVSDRVIIE